MEGHFIVLLAGLALGVAGAVLLVTHDWSDGIVCVLAGAATVATANVLLERRLRVVRRDHEAVKQEWE